MVRGGKDPKAQAVAVGGRRLPLRRGMSAAVAGMMIVIAIVVVAGRMTVHGI